MSEKPTEGNFDADGGSDANSTPSQPKSQPLEADFAKTIADLQRKLEVQDGEIRALKSGKDKAVDRLEKATGETLAKLAKYLDVDEEQVREAQRKSILDDLIAERLNGNPSTPAIQGRVTGSDVPAEPRLVFTAADAIAQAEEFEVSTNDPAFINLLRDKSLSREKVRDYILETKKPSKPASAAGVVQSPARGGATDKSMEALTQEYKQKARSARGNRSEIARLREEYRKQGVPVHEVDFS